MEVNLEEKKNMIVKIIELNFWVCCEYIVFRKESYDVWIFWLRIIEFFVERWYMYEWKVKIFIVLVMFICLLKFRLNMYSIKVIYKYFNNGCYISVVW